MERNHQLVAFLATLLAMCYLVTLAAFLAYNGRYSEAIGVSAAVTGLMGVIKMPSAPAAPIGNVERADTVNQGPANV